MDSIKCELKSKDFEPLRGPKLCPHCHRAAAERENELVERPGWPPMLVHSDCLARDRAKRQQERAKRIEQRREQIQRYCERALAQLPEWSFARATNGELANYVRRKELRGLIKNYGFASGRIALLGPAGLGKTVTLVTLVHRLHDDAVARALAAPPQPHGVYSGDGGDLDTIRGMVFRSAHEIVRARRETPLGTGEAELVTKCTSSTLLVIDELGFESRADDVLMEILDARDKRGRVTWVTSGATSQHIKDRYGSGFWRRISERGVLVEAF